MDFSTVYMFSIKYTGSHSVGDGGTGVLNKSKKTGKLFGHFNPYNMKCKNCKNVKKTFYSLEKCGSGLCVYEVEMKEPGRELSAGEDHQWG